MYLIAGRLIVECWWQDALAKNGEQSSRPGHFSPSPSQNRACTSQCTRLLSFSLWRIINIIGLHFIVPFCNGCIG